jgi:carbon-monoxide dehydrogenase large subunit
VLINPMMVEGQVHGGVAHGIGNTLYEWMGYDDVAQPVTTTLADYLLPTATEVPMLETLYKETRSPLNPLGVKGVGEAGTIPAAAALISAVEDALTPFGARIGHFPLSPMTIVEMIRGGTTPLTGAARTA